MYGFFFPAVRGKKGKGGKSGRVALSGVALGDVDCGGGVQIARFDSNRVFELSLKGGLKRGVLERGWGGVGEGLRKG